MISDLKNGTRIEGEVFLVADSKCGVGNTGKRYLSVSLQDASGDIEGKKWSGRFVLYAGKIFEACKKRT